nr:M20/M25/M40 family metallo-hydrolase [Sphingomicrobium aestuariivivum]
MSSAKAKTAAANGAVGFFEISRADDARARNFIGYLRKNPKVDWIAPDGSPGSLPGALQLSGILTKAGAEAVLGTDLTDHVEAARNGGAVAAVATDASLAASVSSAHEAFTSPNVIARLPGSDPELADEHVIMSAHLDHVGVKPETRGEDKIFNGALDNAAGIATMLEAARLFTLADKAPPRSVTFIALSAEEMGLLGAYYYAAHPTVPTDRIVANVNLDMPVPLYDFTDVVAFGAQYNSVAEKVADAGASLGITVSSDPMPEQNIFVRSDHYAFAQEGVPAILLFTGYANGGEEQWGAFFAERYHQAGDDLSQPLQWDALAKYADLNYRIAETIAADEERPLWYAGTFFGDRFAPGDARATRPAALDSASVNP